jgi:peptidoglycan/LPS O-acetylase OafA/YrhL
MTTPSSVRPDGVPPSAPPERLAAVRSRRETRHARQTRRIPEIDGLRGIALTLVVVFHLFGQGRVSGGVDVFLFVSGLVLALSLQRDVARGEQRHVLRRWTRAFGRLAPPAALVLLTIVALAFTVLPPWNRTQTLLEAGSAALYIENWQLIASQLSYGAAGPLTSPVQHFWSLSIQGQFLIVAPLLVAGVYAARRVLRRPAALLWAIAAAGTAASFAYAVWAQAADPQAAYFDAFARAWELGLGVLLAGAVRRGWRLPAAIAWPLGWVGLAAILGSGFLVDGARAYPGPAALLPVGGAVLVVLASGSSHRMSASGPLQSRPLVALNRYSYALYLWHWPAIIVLLTIRERADGVLGLDGAAIVLAASIVLAVLTQRLVERPLGAWLSRGRGRARFAFVLAAVLVVPVAGGAAFAVGESTRVTVEAGGCHGAAALDPDRPECATPDGGAAPLVPALADLRTDDDNRLECWARPSSDDFAMCSVGEREAPSLRLLAVGDSHSNTLLGAYEQIALAHGWRIDIAGRAACHWTEAVREQVSAALAARCRDWNDAVDELVATTDYDALLVTNSSRAHYRLPAGADLAEYRTRGYAEAWSHRADPTSPVIAIRDNPIFPRDAMLCLQDADRVAAGACAVPRDAALREDGLADAVRADPYAHLVDLTDLMCEPQRCAPAVGGVVVTRDGAHLTATFARTLAPYLDREISAILLG